MRPLYNVSTQSTGLYSIKVNEFANKNCGADINIFNHLDSV